jgi:Tol biopolymer transport system component
MLILKGNRIMSHKIIYVLFIFILLIYSCSVETDDLELKDTYFGLEAPFIKPEIFAEGIISNGFHEHSLAISPDGNEVLYVISDSWFSFYRIVHQKRIENVWQRTEISSFSSDYSDLGPSFSPDGTKLFFASKRPLPGKNEPSEKYRVWYVEKSDTGYGSAQYLKLELHPDGNIANPCLALNGDLYYQYSYADKGWDLYCSKLINGIYGSPENLGDKINTEHNESAPFLSPQNDYLLFHSNRPGGYGRNDIYVSFKQSNNQWGDPINLGGQINTSYGEWRPTLSPDGKYLFFSSFITYQVEDYRGKSYEEIIELYKKPLNGTGTIFWINSDVIKKIKNN